MITRSFLLAWIAAVLLTACGGREQGETVDVSMTQAVQTAFAEILATQGAAVPPATETIAPSPIPPRTPPALPGPFATSVLNPLDPPHAYVQDSCEYLRNKWTPTNSPPGTIVLVVMLHGIEKGETSVTDPKNVAGTNFKQMMNGLHDMGFQAIRAEQLADFLDTNARIPTRSVLVLQDDRKFADNFNTWFRPYWEQWQWPVVNAWINALGGTDPVLAENVSLEQEGWVDHQAHGVVHNIPMSDSSTDDYLTGELEGGRLNMEQNFHKTPVAIIWPGGGFGIRPVEFARKYGYRLGFTTNPRGPIMYNWIPLADEPDPARPLAIPEGPVNDPRMVLPRYWPNQVLQNLDNIRIIGEQAAVYAEQNRAVEFEYYDIVCAPQYGPIPQ